MYVKGVALFAQFKALEAMFANLDIMLFHILEKTTFFVVREFAHGLHLEYHQESILPPIQFNVKEELKVLQWVWKFIGVGYGLSTILRINMNLAKGAAKQAQHEFVKGIFHIKFLQFDFMKFQIG